MAAPALGLSASGRRDPLALALGAGSFAIGVWGALAPRSLGRLLEVDATTARLIGFRDLAMVFVLFSRESRLGIGSRAILDLGDALVFRGRRPLIAGFAATLGAAGLVRTVTIRR
ncbi:MAG TPA: hypothetical protein VK070_03095 [Acidimicrobiia bacterium]|nr:hypothetical protein [Acidimicrobiia bacterium]